MQTEQGSFRLSVQILWNSMHSLNLCVLWLGQIVECQLFIFQSLWGNYSGLIGTALLGCRLYWCSLFMGLWPGSFPFLLWRNLLGPGLGPIYLALDPAVIQGMFGFSSYFSKLEEPHFANHLSIPVQHVLELWWTFLFQEKLFWERSRRSKAKVLCACCSNLPHNCLFITGF